MKRFTLRSFPHFAYLPVISSNRRNGFIELKSFIIEEKQIIPRNG